MRLVDLVRSDDRVEMIDDCPDAHAKDLLRATFCEGLPDAGISAAGSLLVLGHEASARADSYRFDLAVGVLDQSVVALGLIGSEGPCPSMTARRTLHKKGIALVRLPSDIDVADLITRITELNSGDERFALQRVGDVIAAVDRHADDASTGAEFLTKISPAFGSELVLSETRTPGAIRLHTEESSPIYLAAVAPTDHRLPRAAAKPALAYVASAVEAILRRNFERAALPRQTRGDLVNELIQADPSAAADTVVRLRDIGFPVDEHHQATRIDLNTPAASEGRHIEHYQRQQRAASMLLDIAQGGGGFWTRAGTAGSVLLIASGPKPRHRISSRVESIVEAALARSDRGGEALSMTVGVGTAHPGPTGIGLSVQEAISAARAARAASIHNRPHYFDQLGFGQALVRWYEIDGVRATIEELLKPVLALHPDKAQVALETLRAYLDCGRSISATAEALHVHRNTVRYRIERVLERLGLDLDEPDQRLMLELGTRAYSAR